MSVNRINSFALDLYEVFLKQQNVVHENLFFSPVSIYASLACVLAGTKHESEKELSKLLHIDDSISNVKDIHQQIKADLNKLMVKSTETNSILANRLFLDNKVNIKSTYISLLKESYSSEPQNLDFQSNIEITRQIINKWVKDNTENKIKELIPANGLDPQTVLMIVSALYFKGTWKTPFKEMYTRDTEFKLNLKDSKTVPMMALKLYLDLYEFKELDAASILLPFKGSDLNLLIILPNKVEGLSNLMKKLFDKADKHPMSNMNMFLSMENYSTREVNIYLPRFKIGGENSLRLEGHLKTLGVTHIFDAKSADFSNISDSEKLCVSNVHHQAILEVDEKGAEAAAATSFSMQLTSSPIQPLEFKVDHPFIVAIVDNQCTILFLGHVTDPQ